MNALPDTIGSEEELDELMTRPSAALTAFVATLRSPLVVLGASGKMGPSLAAMAKRAAEQAGVALDVIAVARFSDPAARAWLRQRGVATIPCDLLDRDQVMALPAADNVIYMAGRKFGTSGNPALTWAMNTVAPLHAAERYAGARLVALSTGCVYPLVPVDSGGSTENDELTPIGEYANACVARERLLEYRSQLDSTPMVNVRLNYALDMRYGVLVDIATKVAAGLPVDVSMGYLNGIWQGDANDMIIRSLAVAAVPALPLNLTCPQTLGVRALALRFGELLGREPVIVGAEAPTALLNNPARACALLGMPATPIETVIRWTAAWIARNGRTLGKPTHYEAADGRY